MHYQPIARWRRAAVIGLPALLVALSGAVIQWVRLSTRSSGAAAARARAVAVLATDLARRLTQLESAQRAYLLTGDRAFLSGTASATTTVGREIDSLSSVADRPTSEHRAIAQLQSLAGTRLAALRADQDALPTRELAVATPTLRQSAALMDSVYAIVAGLQDVDRRAAVRDAAELAQRRNALNVTVLVGTTVAMVVALAINFLLAAYARDREQSAALLTTQAGQLEQQNATLRRQATELTETNRELGATTARLEATTSDLVATAAERERAREAAEEANRAKQTFLTNVSHDLRTPLNAIIGYASLLNDGVHGTLSAEQGADVGRMAVAARHLLGLVNELLSFARVDAGYVQIAHQVIAVDEILATAYSMANAQADAKGLTLARLPCATGISAVGDHEKIVQIVVNLLSNAVKFTAPGGHIELACHPDQDTVRIAVADTGRGIPPDHLTRVFEPFVQVDRQRGSDGLGLGLAISRELARAMGGDVTATSVEGKGSCFTLTMPRGVSAPAAPPLPTPLVLYDVGGERIPIHRPNAVNDGGETRAPTFSAQLVAPQDPLHATPPPELAVAEDQFRFRAADRYRPHLRQA